MFQITTSQGSLETNTTLPDISQDKQSIFVPCFYLTNSSETRFENDNSSTSISNLTNFAPMFVLASNDEEVMDVEDFSYILSTPLGAGLPTIPSQYQMLEVDLDVLQPLDNISSLYINGSKYQNLLEIENLVLFTTKEDVLPLEEREST